MTTPPGSSRTDPESRSARRQLIAIVVITVFVMVMGVLVVAFPHSFGLPGLDGAATPTGTEEPEPLI